MKLIDPSYELLQQGPDLLVSAKKMIELAGRTCYKSEDKITSDSYEKFFDMLVDRNHTSVLEHGSVYFKIVTGSPIDDGCYLEKLDLISFFRTNYFSRIREVKDYLKNNEGTVLASARVFYISTNYRVIQENFKDESKSKLDFRTKETLFKYLCQPTEQHDKRVTVKFICSRAIANEIVRHRVLSFSQESQRYVNYSKDKFGKEVTFINPSCNKDCPKFVEALQQAENNYFYLLSIGWLPQEARDVLPNATKTEIVVTGYLSDWEQFFKLRCSEKAHPEMRRLMCPLKEEMLK